VRISIDALSVIPGECGGGETYVQGLVNALGEAGSDHEYLVFVTPESRGLFVTKAKNLRFHIVQFENRTRVTRVLYEQLRLPIVIRNWGADVVHFPGNMISAFLPWMRVPTVVTIHDASPFFYRDALSTYMSKWRRWTMTGFTQYAAHHATAIATDSEFSRGEVCGWTHVRPDKVFVVSPGYERNNLEEAVGGELSRLDSYKPYVLMVGRSNKHKNYDGFVRAFARARREYRLPHHLVIVGAAGSGHSDLLSAIESAEAGQFTHLTGYVPSATLSSLYREAQWFAMPSLYEGFGFPVLEAMQFSVPTILSDAGSLQEVGGEAAVYIDPHDTDSISETLGRALPDMRLRRDLSETGQRQRTRFSWQRTALEMVQVYQRAANWSGRKLQ
jgi:glycosyltransferase involved in cell wall biosynthesis